MDDVDSDSSSGSPVCCAECGLPLRVLHSGAVRHYGVSTLIRQHVES